MDKKNLFISQTTLKFGIPSYLIVRKLECIYYEKGTSMFYECKHAIISKMSSNKFNHYL